MSLFIGVDAEKVVVSPRPLRMARGRGRRRRYGSVVELRPVPVSGRSRDDRMRRTSQIALPLIGMCAIAHLLGISWWLPALASLLVVGTVVRLQAQAARPGSVALPHDSRRPARSRARSAHPDAIPLPGHGKRPAGPEGLARDSAGIARARGSAGVEGIARPRDSAGTAGIARARGSAGVEGIARRRGSAESDGRSLARDAWRPAPEIAGVVGAPGERESFVLVAPEERAAYARALDVSRRVRRTWPELGELVDPAEADRVLTRALEELASLMARRQQLRRLRAELADVREGGLPEDSPAVRALEAQRRRVDELWRVSGRQANRMLGGIDAAALAGENLIRERLVHETAQRAELTIARLAAPGATPMTGAAPELAERTAAVIAAYRELHAI